MPDIQALHREFAAGLRARYGTVPLAGIPRMTRPRARKNNDGVTGFSLVDPGGNWIRISAGASAAVDAKTGGRLATTLANAVVLADSYGDHRQAARILDGALGRPDAADDPVTLVEALVYRAEMAVALADADTALRTLKRVGRIELSPDQRQEAADSLHSAAEMTSSLERGARLRDGRV